MIKKTLLLFILLTLNLQNPFAQIQPKIHWERLQKYHYTLTEKEFRNIVRRIYSPTGSLDPYLTMTPSYVDLYRDKRKTKPALFRLFFAKDALSKKRNPTISVSLSNFRHQKTRTDPTPLKGIKILIDPGHIGGPYASIEQRILKDQKGRTTNEGNLNLITAKLLRKKLQSYGAIVYLTKENLEPVTKLRPKDFEKQAREKILKKGLHAKPTLYEQSLMQKEMNLQFYRISEIEARAELANRLKPDLTLCIHFNASPAMWTKDNRLIVFIHGYYLSEELQDEEQKFRLFSKLLEGSCETEIALAEEISTSLAAQTGLPPIHYNPNPYYSKISNHPYVFARNLAANRRYPGPVIYLEPYYQNNFIVFERLLAGDYEGTKKIRGKYYKSIFREYTDGVVDGLLNYFRKPISSTSQRTGASPPSKQTPKKSK